MTGALLVMASGGQGIGAGAGGAPGPLAWSNPYGSTMASTQALTIAGVGGGAAPVTASNTGGAMLSYVRNGVSTPYTGAFTVSDGDSLAWTLLNLTTSTRSGTVAVTSGAVTVGTFSYVVRGNTYF